MNYMGGASDTRSLTQAVVDAAAVLQAYRIDEARRFVDVVDALIASASALDARLGQLLHENARLEQKCDDLRDGASRRVEDHAREMTQLRDATRRQVAVLVADYTGRVEAANREITEVTEVAAATVERVREEGAHQVISLKAHYRQLEIENEEAVVEHSRDREEIGRLGQTVEMLLTTLEAVNASHDTDNRLVCDAIVQVTPKVHQTPNVVVAALTGKQELRSRAASL